jgi:hypothetical protein
LEKHLHIIDFTIPYPVQYGGLIDLFYKLPALQNEGVQIHLHCFVYNNQEQPALEKYCASVHYYPRLTGHKAFCFHLPYIVSSRMNEVLAETLLKDDFPILMEGIHTTFLLNDLRFAKRKKFVRLHNVEHMYYKELAYTTHSYFDKIYYLRESFLLKKYESSINKSANAFWAVTQKDVAYFKEKLNYNNIDYLPVYLPDSWRITQLSPIGSYCLFQADLSVAINEEAALWLIEHVFSKNDIPLVVAGKNPSLRLQKKVHKYSNCCLVENPSEKEMQDMISKAHILVVYGKSEAGIKLKLLNALFNGRHCIVNPESIAGTGLESLCHIAKTAQDYLYLTAHLFNTPFKEDCTRMRKELLDKTFNNRLNAQKQVKWIWGNEI